MNTFTSTGIWFDIMRESFRTAVTISQYWISFEFLFSLFVHFFFLFVEIAIKSTKKGNEKHERTDDDHDVGIDETDQYYWLEWHQNCLNELDMRKNDRN